MNTIKKLFNYRISGSRFSEKKTISECDFYNLNSLPFNQFNIIFDVGAYHGNTVEKLIPLNETARIIAFEPSSLSFDILQRKFVDVDRVTCVKAAISNTLGSSKLFINHYHETNSLLESVKVDKEIDKLTSCINEEVVELQTLDSYCDSHDINTIDLLKIDTQGNSFNVLEGAQGLLLNGNIDHIFAEVEFVEIYKGEKRFSEIELLLRNAGYEFLRFYNMNYINNGQLAWADALFTKSKKSN